MTTVRLPIDVQTAHSQTAEDEEEDAGPKLVMPEELSCPICLKLMMDPVMAEDGQTYQRQAIEEWISKCIAGTVPEHRRWYRLTPLKLLYEWGGTIIRCTYASYL
jgi:hypothetical protein